MRASVFLIGLWWWLVDWLAVEQPSETAVQAVTFGKLQALLNALLEHSPVGPALLLHLGLAMSAVGQQTNSNGRGDH